MKYKNYYAILDVETNATKEEIRKAFRNLAKQYHPDANPGDKEAEERFKDVNEAHTVLTDDEKRKKYDTLMQKVGFQKGFSFDPSKYKREFKGDASPFSDFFNIFFGNNSINLDEILGGLGLGGRGSNNKTCTEQQYDFNGNVFPEGADVETEILVSLEEAFFGAEKKITSRQLDDQERTYLVKIPPGIRDGEKIRLAGLGQPDVNNQRGDLFIKVKFKKHSIFKLEGSDLVFKLQLAPWEAALGCKVKIPCIDGTLSIKIPRGIQSGQRLRLSGKGYKSGSGGRGDLFVEVFIMVPKELTNAEIRLFEEMQEISKFNPREQK